MKEILKKRGSVFCSIGAWDALNKTLHELQPTKVFIIVDSQTIKHCKNYFLSNYYLTKNPEFIEIPSGETHKTIETCVTVWNQLSNKEADRKSVIINLGGGVVTDLGAFVACTFKRGIPFINIPTTLLSMVDASVGGKNGVDLGLLKNQVGIIKEPQAVIIDTYFLKSLEKNQIISGYAEMLKHGLIHSINYWNTAKNINPLQIDQIEDALWESVLIKNEVVTNDPFEHGIRKTLNYGHTLGHAIESYSLSSSSIPSLLHGEAIAIGMILATFISSKLTGFPTNYLEDISEFIISKYQKVIFNNNDVEEILKLLIYDKKNVDGKILFVLLKNIGEPQINCEVPNSVIFDAFSYYKNL